MDVFENLLAFRQAYISGQTTSHGFDRWAITFVQHTSDEQYQKQQQQGTSLGFKPTLLTLADPLEEQSREVVIKNLPDQQAQGLMKESYQRLSHQLEKRFGLFQPAQDRGLVEYDSWQEFKNVWLERDGRSLLTANLPLLFDHPTNLEYWAWRQKGVDPVGYQRLLVTLFQPRKRQFYRIFIKNSNDDSRAEVHHYTASMLQYLGT